MTVHVQPPERATCEHREIRASSMDFRTGVVGYRCCRCGMDMGESEGWR